MGKRVKRPSASKGNRLTAKETINYNERPPVFSLERIQNGQYCLSALERIDKAAFADAIYRRRQITWQEIIDSGRHGLGFEKIPRHQIQAGIPRFITEDVDHFLAFRFSGTKPMVGYRRNDVFFVLWFDHDFTLYPH